MNATPVAPAWMRKQTVLNLIAFGIQQRDPSKVDFFIAEFEKLTAEQVRTQRLCGECTEWDDTKPWGATGRRQDDDPREEFGVPRHPWMGVKR